MSQHILDFSQYIPTIWMQSPGFLNGGFVAIGAIGVMMGLLATSEPEDPTDI